MWCSSIDPDISSGFGVTIIILIHLFIGVFLVIPQAKENLPSNLNDQIYYIISLTLFLIFSVGSLIFLWLCKFIDPGYLNKCRNGLDEETLKILRDQPNTWIIPIRKRIIQQTYQESKYNKPLQQESKSLIQTDVPNKQPNMLVSTDLSQYQSTPPLPPPLPPSSQTFTLDINSGIPPPPPIQYVDFDAEMEEFCRQCLIWRPPRSGHCSVCEICVERLRK